MKPAMSRGSFSFAPFRHRPHNDVDGSRRASRAEKSTVLLFFILLFTIIQLHRSHKTSTTYWTVVEHIPSERQVYKICRVATIMVYHLKQNHTKNQVHQSFYSSPAAAGAAPPFLLASIRSIRNCVAGATCGVYWK
jgi:hypothetical protein